MAGYTLHSTALCTKHRKQWICLSTTSETTALGM